MANAESTLTGNAELIERVSDFKDEVMFKICEVDALITTTQKFLDDDTDGTDEKLVSAFYLHGTASKLLKDLWIFVDAFDERDNKRSNEVSNKQ